MRKRFLYYLKKDNSTYYVVSGGAVITTTVETPFAADPIEWQESQLQYMRHVTYHGITFKYAAPLSMVKDAALILRHVMMIEGGMEAPCIFVAKKIDDDTQVYSTYFTCDVDFSQATNTELFVQVELLERGLYQMIKDRENTPYDIPIDFSDRIAVYHDGIDLEGDYIYSTLARASAVFNSNQLWSFEAISIAKDGDFTAGQQHDQTFMAMGTPPSPSWSSGSAEHNNYIYKADKFLTGGVDVRIRASHEIEYTNYALMSSAAFSFQCRYLVANEAAGTVTQQGTIYTDPVLPVNGGLRRVLLNFTSGLIHLNPDDRLYYVFFISGVSSSNTTFLGFFGQQKIEVLIGFRLNPTFIYGYWYRQLFAKLVAKMTAGEYGSRSDFLNAGPSYSVVDNHPGRTLAISGDGIRNLSVSTAPALIKTSLKELFKDASDRWMLGMGAEGDGAGGFQIRLEQLPYFYDNLTVILELDIVTNFQWKYAIEYINNQLKIGNPNIDYDKLNGRDEPNTTQVYKLPITRKQSEMDMITPYRADTIGIEQVRANLTDKKTTDSSSDNDTFVIELEDNPANQTIGGATVNAYSLRRQQNIGANSASGVRSPTTIYNLSLSPKRNLYRNGSVIRAAAFQQELKTITFQTTDKNPNLVSNLGSGTITEKADVPVSSLDAPIFLPLLFQFETPVPVNLPAIVDGYPYGRINFSVQLGNEIKSFGGFIYDISIKPGTNGACKWQLLAAPDTDLSQLIF